MTSPSGFSTPPQILNNTTSERPPVITTVFVATTPENTPFAYRASTSANPNPMISPAFVESNYEVLESLLRERRTTEQEGSRRGRNAEGIRPSKIEAREDENRGVNLPPLFVTHLGTNKSSQPLRSSLTSVHGGHQPSTNMGGNLPPNGTLLSHHAQPFIPSSLHTPTRLVPIYANPYSQPSVSLANGKILNFPFQTQIGNPSARGISTYQMGGIYHRRLPTMM
ncbi:hypothetical protein Tco_1484618 [Tanacetum coccineum]